MPKGWRFELVGVDGKTRILVVAISDRPKAIRAALAGKKSSSVSVYPLSAEEYDLLSLTEGDMKELGGDNPSSRGR